MSDICPSPEVESSAGSGAGTPPAAEMKLTSSLEDLQTDEQRRVLDTVAQVRKCGLDSILSLPQLVVCGDQSAGKSSVLEALTGVPFPRNDNLCTRFATEISMRRAPHKALTIKLIPDAKRPPLEQSNIKAFQESITDFDQLPRIMEMARTAMGIADTDYLDAKRRAFARDVLSIEICGPTEPQLTLVDIPGLIATPTKGVTDADVDMVAEITDHYIKQQRTICLAVVSAMNDYANQKILKKVRDVDPDGNRTLGIITKPDVPPSDSGSQKAFLELAQNKDIFFKLGWHVLKNRKFEERDFNLMERHLSETTFFHSSNFKCLPAEFVGIDALRSRLSVLLFEHVKSELPKLRQDLETALDEARDQLSVLGHARSSPSECKAYLSQLSLSYHNTCKAAINGHYEDPYFRLDIDRSFDFNSPSTVRRTRAVVQSLNTIFERAMRTEGELYEIDMTPHRKSKSTMEGNKLTRNLALKWVRQALIRTRGKELVGNFNPLLIAELFWEQSTKWHGLAVAHIESVADICRRFLKTLLHDRSPKDIESRVWSMIMEEALDARLKAASKELDLLIKEVKDHPINYNHHYTETINARRQDRQKEVLTKCVQDASTTENFLDEDLIASTVINVDANQVVENYFCNNKPDMENFSCEEALDCLQAIYKVQEKVFIANVTTQVIERHIISNLEEIFSPVKVNILSDTEVEAIASEPLPAKNLRKFLEDKIEKLEAGQKIFKAVIGGGL